MQRHPRRIRRNEPPRFLLQRKPERRRRKRRTRANSHNRPRVVDQLPTQQQIREIQIPRRIRPTRNRGEINAQQHAIGEQQRPPRRLPASPRKKRRRLLRRHSRRRGIRLVFCCSGHASRIRTVAAPDTTNYCPAHPLPQTAPSAAAQLGFDSRIRQPVMTHPALGSFSRAGLSVRPFRVFMPLQPPSSAYPFFPHLASASRLRLLRAA